MKRQFFLGDEWIYYKLFCGKRSADMVLIEGIKPLTKELLECDYIDQWFFIRYGSPDSHLRVRFHLNDISHIGAVIDTVKTHLETYHNQGVIWSVQTDTYSRELERYGLNTIEDTESMFCLDSQFCTDALSLIDDDKLSLASIDGFLSQFRFNISQKVDFTKQMFETFKQEFEAEKQLNRQLNLKYQSLKDEIRIFMTEQPEEYTPLYRLLSHRDSALKAIAVRVDQILQAKDDFKTDYLKHHVHMMVNRIFRDQQRLHEMVCYSCFYQSQKNKA